MMTLTFLALHDTMQTCSWWREKMSNMQEVTPSLCTFCLTHTHRHTHTHTLRQPKGPIGAGPPRCRADRVAAAVGTPAAAVFLNTQKKRGEKKEWNCFGLPRQQKDSTCERERERERGFSAAPWRSLTRVRWRTWSVWASWNRTYACLTAPPPTCRLYSLRKLSVSLRVRDLCPLGERRRSEPQRAALSPQSTGPLVLLQLASNRLWVLDVRVKSLFL